MKKALDILLKTIVGLIVTVLGPGLLIFAWWWCVTNFSIKTAEMFLQSLILIFGAVFMIYMSYQLGNDLLKKDKK